MMKNAFGLILGKRGLAVVLLLVISVAAGIGLGRLKFDDELDTVFRGTTPEHRLLDELGSQIPLESSEFFLLVETRDLISSEKIGALWDLQFDLLDLDEVGRVRSILQLRDKDLDAIIPAPGSGEASFKKTRETLVKEPIPSISLAKDGDATLLVVEPSGQPTAVSDLEKVYRKIETIVAEVNANGRLSASVTGLPAMRCDLVRIQRSELPRFLLAGTLLGLVASWAMFRSGAAILLMAPVPVLAAFWSLGLMGLFGRTFDLMSIVITPLAMTIAITEAIHLLSGIREGIEEGRSPIDASRYGLGLVGPSCLLATVTTMIAFASLTLLQSPILARLGITCAGVTALVFVSTVLWVPLAASTSIGQRIGRNSPGSVFVGSARFTGAIFRHSTLIVVASVGTLVFCLIQASGIRPDYQFSEFLPSSHPSTAALHRIDAVFGGSNRIFVMVEWPEGSGEDSPQLFDVLRSIEEILEDEKMLGNPFSMASTGEVFQGGGAVNPKELWRELPREVRDQFTNAEVRRTVVAAPVADRGARLLLPMFERIEEALDRLKGQYPGFDIKLTGSTYVHALMSGGMIGELLKGLLAGSLGIFLVVGLALGSVDLAVRSILPNVLPLAGVVALVVWMGGSLHYNGVLALTIGLGIAIDDSVHYLYRFKREMMRNGGNRHEAIMATSRSVGLALVTTTVVLVAGFGVLLGCSLPMARHFAILIIGVLTLALLADLVILPAILEIPRRRKGPERNVKT